MPDDGMPASKSPEKEEEGAQPAAGAGSAREVPPSPSRPLPAAQLGALREELEAARDFQALHRRERQKDARSCRGCLRSARALEEHLEALRARLATAEARLGLPPPPPRAHQRPAGAAPL